MAEEVPAHWEPFGATIKRLRARRAIRQLDLATDLSVDHSLVSRWESGAVLPTVKDVDKLKIVLRVSDGEAEDISYAWERERDALSVSRFGSAISSEAQDWVESLRVSIDCVRALRHAGQPRTALILSDRDAVSALNGIRRQAWTIEHEQALVELVELLLEQCKAGLDYLSREAVRRGELEPPMRLQEFAASATHSVRAATLARITREGTSYVSGNVGLAHDIGLQLLTQRDDVPVEWLPEVLRACAINAGRLEEPEGLDLVSNLLSQGFLDELEASNGTRAFVLEGVARGILFSDAERGLEILSEAWILRERATDAESTSRLRFVQLARTQAEMELMLGSRGNLEDTLRKLSKALQISEVEKYDRYIQQLTRLGEKLAHQ